MFCSLMKVCDQVNKNRCKLNNFDNKSDQMNLEKAVDAEVRGDKKQLKSKRQLNLQV